MRVGRGTSHGALAQATRVVVIDDHVAVAQSLAAALDDQRDIQCVGLAATAEAGQELIAALQPDVVVIDQGLPGMDGVEATSRIVRAHPGIRVVMLTAAPANAELVASAAAAGACAFVPKTGALDDLLSAVRDARPGGMLVETSLLTANAEPEPVPRRAAPNAPTLTPREQDVLELLALGIDAGRVAQRLGISVHTCRGHLRSLLVKLDSHSQLEAVVTATRLGLLDVAPHG